MRYLDDARGLSRDAVAATQSMVRRFQVAGADVIMLDIENVGAAALTDLKVFGRASAGGPMRDLTPLSWTDETAFVWQPPSMSPTTLAPGSHVQLGLNVAALYEIELRAAGDGAALSIAAGLYEVGA